MCHEKGIMTLKWLRNRQTTDAVHNYCLGEFQRKHLAEIKGVWDTGLNFKIHCLKHGVMPDYFTPCQTCLTEIDVVRTLLRVKHTSCTWKQQCTNNAYVSCN